jgi:hexosaminidase
LLTALQSLLGFSVFNKDGVEEVAMVFVYEILRISLVQNFVKIPSHGYTRLIVALLLSLLTSVFGFAQNNAEIATHSQVLSDVNKMPPPKLPAAGIDTGKVVLPFGSTLYGSDNKQIVALDGSFYRPLVDMNVNVMYEVNFHGDKKLTGDINFRVPGKYPDRGINPAPKVVPGIREWYGGASGANFILQPNASISTAGGAEAQWATDKTKEFFAAMLGVILIDVTTAGEGGVEMIFKPELRAELGDDGYYLHISDKISITAGTKRTDVWWCHHNANPLCFCRQAYGSCG